MSTEQQRVQNSTDHLYKAMSEAAKHFDANGISLNESAKKLLSIFDREAMIFLNTIDLYGKSVNTIIWNGQSTNMMGLLLTLNNYIEHMNQKTNYKFNSQSWFKR